MLSTNNNPIYDFDVDEDFTEDPKFFLISPTGAAADHRCDCDTLGLFGQSEVERNVYFQEDENPETWCYKLVHHQGFWVVMSSRQSIYLRSEWPTSESPASVKWQYYDWEQSIWRDDQTLTVISLSEKPTCECEVTIRLSSNIARDIGDPGVSGVYRPDGTSWEGRQYTVASM